MKEEKLKYIIHLQDGDTIKINGIPCRVMGQWEVMTNTNPRTFAPEMKHEEVADQELSDTN